jgi:uncharacterized damage-inducible protein DinB
MNAPWTERPARDEYADFYSGYVGAAPDGDILETLEREGERAVALLRELPAERSRHAYAPGKWTVRELIAHVSDAERVFSYRALRFGRADPTPLASFDQEVWWPHAHADKRRWTDLVDEFRTVRAATLHLFRSFEPEDWLRRGTASGVGVSVRALAWITAGHELHHRRVLREKYGVG